jgi:ankyrin repeat protein
MGDRFINIKDSHAKTCIWVLNSTEYLNWLSIDRLPEHYGFFWIKGKPGCGKSTLVKFMLLHVEKTLPNTKLLSFFFNARGDQLEKSTLGLYRSLLLQLLESCLSDQLVWNISNLTLSSKYDQLKTDRETLKHVFVEVTRLMERTSVMIVIDALDECDEDEVRDMVAFFEKLGEEAFLNGREFRVLFSSRHYPHVTVQRFVELKLEDQEGHSQDIDKYLSQALRIGSNKLAEQTRRELHERASGVFMWVVLVVNILNRAFDHGQVHALRKKLHEIPNGLNELFRQMLTRDSQNLDEMKLCLQWILYAIRPMTREELYFAIFSGSEEPFAWDPNEVSTETMDLFILSASKGLAEITESTPPSSPTVQFIHESVRDFLLKDNDISRTREDLSVNLFAKCHERLKQYCMNYINSVASDYLVISDSLHGPTDSKREYLPPRFPFLAYAINNVLAHADKSHAEGISQEDFVQRFELHNWITVYNSSHLYDRYPEDISFMYVLADQNCPNLITVLMKNQPCTGSEKGDYGFPVCAAIRHHYEKVLEALSKCSSHSHPYNCQFENLGEEITSYLEGQRPSLLCYRFLSNYFVNVDKMPFSGPFMLGAAAKHGHKKLIEMLLDQGVDINLQSRKYGSALHEALSAGNNHIVELLLNRGANIDLVHERHGTPLQVVVSPKRKPWFELLLAQGADVNMQGGYYGNALQAAIVLGNEYAAKVLLDQGANVNMLGGRYGTALQAASSIGSEHIVELLINQGADVNAQGGHYGTALQAASLIGSEHIVTLLIDQEADVNVQGGEYGTALQAAIASESENIVMLLLAQGADVNVQGGYFGNALQVASASGSDEHMVKLLLDHGADVNAQGGHYGTALQAASASGSDEHMVKLLLDHGADVNAQGGHYGTALQAASSSGNEHIVTLLIDQGADVNLQGGQYGTALQAAAAFRCIDIFQLLLDHGAKREGVMRE